MGGGIAVHQKLLTTDAKALGERLRRIRRRAGRSLKEVAGQAGCSESLLSKVETGRANPSLSMLHRIVATLDTSMANLFVDGGSNERVVYRHGERPRIHLDSGESAEIALERLIPDDGDHLLQANVHVIAPGAGSRGPITHEGEEFGYVLTGELELTVGGRTHVVSAGDCFVFRSEVPHAYRNAGDATARVLWVNTPVTF